MPETGGERILVTDASELAGLGTVRSVGRAGYRVTPAVSEKSRNCATGWSRFAQPVITHPDPWKCQNDFRAWLDAQARSGQWRAILPLSEASIFAAAAIRSQLSTATVVIAPSDDHLRYTLSKYCATQAALSAGIPCPQTVFVTELMTDEDALHAMGHVSLPTIIKIDNQYSNGRYSKGRTFSVRTLAEAEWLLPDIRRASPRLLIQQQVRGFGVGSFFLRSGGKTLLQFAHRRLHEVPYTGGYSSFRVSTDDPAAIELGKRLLDRIGYEGLAMAEFRRNPATGATYFLEINGRVWGSIALALHAGVDFPAKLVDCYLGRKTSEQGQYRAGIKCRHLPGEIAHTLSVLKDADSNQKLRAMWEFVRLSADPRIHHDHFWWSDPLPGVFQVFETAKLMAGGAAGRVFAADRRHPAEQKKSRETELLSRPIRRVLFLCYGNICRSPFAEHYWNGALRRDKPSLPEAISAGFFEPSGRVTPGRFQRLAATFSCDLNAHRSQVCNREMLDTTDLVMVMDRQNYASLARNFPDAIAKTLFLGPFGDANSIEIADPFLNNDPEEASRVYGQIATALHNLALQFARRT